MAEGEGKNVIKKWKRRNLFWRHELNEGVSYLMEDVKILLVSKIRSRVIDKSIDRWTKLTQIHRCTKEKCAWAHKRTHTHTRARAYIYIYVCVGAYTCIYIYIYIYIYVGAYACIYIYIYVGAYTYKNLCMCNAWVSIGVSTHDNNFIQTLGQNRRIERKWNRYN